jgi:hypothetical protein
VTFSDFATARALVHNVEHVANLFSKVFGFETSASLLTLLGIAAAQ